MPRIPRTKLKSVPMIVRRRFHSDKLPGGFVTVDYSKADDKGCFLIFGVYHPQRKILYHAKIQTTGSYNKWTNADVLHQLT